MCEVQAARVVLGSFIEVDSVLHPRIIVIDEWKLRPLLCIKDVMASETCIPGHSILT